MELHAALENRMSALPENQSSGRADMNREEEWRRY